MYQTVLTVIIYIVIVLDPDAAHEMTDNNVLIDMFPSIFERSSCSENEDQKIDQEGDIKAYNIEENLGQGGISRDDGIKYARRQLSIRRIGK